MENSQSPDRNALRAQATLFKTLHEGPDILILPNAWDVGSAVIMAQAGFPAIATTSSGIAFAQGYPDGERISRDEMLQVVARIARKVSVPVTADLEAGYGPRPEDVAETVRRAIRAGVVGANFEDGTGRASDPLFDLTLGAERIRAAREAADAEGVPFVVNARTDGYLRRRELGKANFDDAVRRANAYREAGADCLFVPGVVDAETIGKLVAAIDGPLNILAALSGVPAPPLAELQALGVARVSIGGSLALAALALVRRSAEELLAAGTYSYAGDALANAELNRLMAD